jgi:hypothetical protein
MSHHLKVSAHQKENTCSNVFSLINVTAGFSYLVYNFYIEFGNWDTIAAKYASSSSTYTDPKTNRTTITTWQVSTVDEAESQVMRLEQVCKNIDMLQNIFLAVLALTSTTSALLFIHRQYDICSKAMSCSDTRWCVSMILLMILTCIQSMVGLFLIILLSPTSFLTCYKIIARYFCTITLAIVVLFAFYNIILSSIAKPILNHIIPYDKLTAIGEHCEVDVVTQKAKRKRQTKRFNDNKEIDEEEVELTSSPYTDNKYDENNTV